jgi:hypothetical protein
MIHLLVVVLIAGVIVWLITSFLPMEAKIKQLFIGLTIFFLLLYILDFFGLINIPH